MLPGGPIRRATMMVRFFLFLPLYNCAIAVCESYQDQFELDTKETVKQSPLDRRNYGISYCIDQCETTHYDSCVAVDFDMINEL